MRNVLADLAVEAEAATIVAMRMAGATDGRGARRRTGDAAAPHRAGRVQVLGVQARDPHAGEAMECLGGNGYAEESGMPRLYREAPLMGIWEVPATSARWTRCAPWQLGPNAWRCCSTSWRSPRAMIRGWTPTQRLRDDLADLETIEYRARKVAEDISLALQGSLLVRHGHPAVAEAFLPPGWAVSGAGVRHPADRAGPGADPRAPAW